MSEKVLADADGRPYTGQDVLYRENGVTALDVQRAADALLRRGQKPSIAAVREELGGGSPNTLAPLLEKYWKGLGTRLPAGPESLERVPESLARMTEALWLRSLDEARERAKIQLAGTSDAQRMAMGLERQLTALNAALAESRARCGELELQLLDSLRERLELRDQLLQVTSLLKAEQELRAHEREAVETRGRELQLRRTEALTRARRRIRVRLGKQTAAMSIPAAKSRVPKVKSTRRAAVTGRRTPPATRRTRRRE